MDSYSSKMVKVSIIVPVYNVEKYISRCIDSLLAQTFTDYELILVDDGTPDNSGKICDEYALKDERVKVIHKENGGVSSARNTGIDNAQGKYIIFVDSDDYVAPNYVKWLWEQMQNQEVIMATTSVIFTDGVDTEYSRRGVGETQIVPTNNIYQIVDLGIMYGVLNKIYYSEIIKKNNLRFDESISHGEDAIFVLGYLMLCNRYGKVAFLSEPLYYYFVDHQGSLSKKYDSKYWDIEKRLLENLKLMLIYFEVDEKNADRVWLEKASWTVVGSILNVMTGEESGKSQRNHIREIIRSEIGCAALTKGDYSFVGGTYGKLLKKQSVNLIWLYNRLYRIKNKK